MASLRKSFPNGFIENEIIYRTAWAKHPVRKIGIVKDIDFINKNIDQDGKIQWTALQVKNSDNSENAASSRVRVGTNIKNIYT